MVRRIIGRLVVACVISIERADVPDRSEGAKSDENPGYQSILKDPKDSTRQRMVAIESARRHPRSRVGAHEVGVDHDKAAQLVRLGQVIRRLETAGGCARWPRQAVARHLDSATPHALPSRDLSPMTPSGKRASRDHRPVSGRATSLTAIRRQKRLHRRLSSA